MDPQVLSLEALPWVAAGCIAARFAWHAVRSTQMRAQLDTTHHRLADALARLDRLETIDRTTGLPNREALQARVLAAMEESREQDRALATILVDLDRYRKINRSLGHDVGDRVMREAAGRIRAAVRPGDFVARLEGDQLVIVVQDADASVLEAIAEAARAAFDATFEARGHEIALSVSIGIARYPLDGKSPDELLVSAGVAKDRAKESGGNRACFHSRPASGLSHERLALEASLRHALDRGEIDVAYQPKVSFCDNRVIGAEALVRWRHPVLGPLGPERFVPLAEEAGLIVPLGRYVLRRACEQVRAWAGEGVEIPIAVNLGAEQFHDPGLPAQLAALLAQYSVSPASLELEITESVAMRDPDRACLVMHALRAMGLRLALDDFGVGQSSLAALKRFPLDGIKIDRAFVQDLPDAGSAAIVRAMVAMAHGKNLDVVAEGVETAAQRASVQAEGCDAYQGFLCSAALSGDDLLRFVLAERALHAAAILRARLACTQAAERAAG